MNEPEKLKPCPFCGEGKEIYPGYEDMGNGKCTSIHCLGCGTLFEFDKDAVALVLWNRRPNE